MKIFLKIITLISVAAITPALKSQTIIPGGYVSGNWEAANSPYIIQDNILVHPDSTLMISAGITVLFAAESRLEVQGQLLVSGTPSDPVVFDSENLPETWRGIQFNHTDTSITDSSILENGIVSHCFGNSCLTLTSASRVRVSDFTVQNGEAFRGGGISCTDSNPYFSGLLVQYNQAPDGAGIFLEISSPVMRNCTITQNAAGGAGGGMVIFDGSDPVIENCLFSDNLSFGSGGGVYINGAAPVFRECRFYNNEGAIGGSTLYSGGAVSVKLGCDPVFENCVFEENLSQRSGGGIASFSVTKIVNCLFSSNEAVTIGGAVFLSSGNLITSPVTNCTFSDNNASQGSALATHSHKAVARNCIFWHSNPSNPNSIIYLESSFSWNLLDIAYCDLQNGEDGIEDAGTTYYTWGSGNIDPDPAFIPGSAELSWQSPCIEAGTPDTSGLMLPLLDLAGNPRLANERVDMGAFEYQLALQIPNSKFQIASDWRIFPNPTRDWVYIEINENLEGCTIQLINASGSVLSKKDLPSGEKSVKIDLRGYSAGIYLVRVSENGIFTANTVIIKD